MQIELKTFKDTPYKVKRDLWFNMETPDDVVNEICRLASTGTRVRLFLGDMVTGKCWQDEHEVTGTISRSMGPVKAPLLIHNSRSMGGGAILTHCIIGIKGPHRWLYRHPTLDVGAWAARAIPEDSDLYADGYRTEVTCDGCTHANFKGPNSLARADRYIAFMKGERMAK